MLKINILGQMSEEAANRVGFIKNLAFLISAIALLIGSFTIFLLVYYHYVVGIK